MVERNVFPADQTHQYRISQWGENDCIADNKKNGDYYEYRSLTHFTDKFWFYRKWWKENLFLQIRSINITYPIVENKIVSFSCKFEASIHVSDYGEQDCSADNERKGDYYENPSLTHFTDELWL